MNFPLVRNFLPRGLEGEITGGDLSGIELLVKPLIGRHEKTARLPIQLDRLLSLGPFQGVALTGEDQNVSSGLMAVGFFISPHGKLGHVQRHAVAAHFELYVASKARDWDHVRVFQRRARRQ